MQELLLLDNTLREGEQAPGIFFSYEEKVRLCVALDQAGIDRLDVGIPATSAEDARFCAEAVRLVCRAVPGVTIRALEQEVDLAAELGAPEAYVMFPFSEIHIERKFRSSVAEIRARCSALLRRARERGVAVNLVAEDASRRSVELVCELAEHAAREGARQLLICDTVGTALPSRFGALVGEVVRAVGSVLRVGVHCHNDLGLAGANTLAALEAGATVASVTVNGLGERAGNASLQEVAVAARMLLGARHGLDLRRLPELAGLVESISGLFLSPLAPVVGRNAFVHESGIHVDGLLKDDATYEALRPETVGRTRRFVLGKSSGINQLAALLEARGIRLDRPRLELLRRAVQATKRAQDRSARAEMAARLERYYESLLACPLDSALEAVLEPARSNELPE